MVRLFMDGPRVVGGLTYEISEEVMATMPGWRRIVREAMRREVAEERPDLPPFRLDRFLVDPVERHHVAFGPPRRPGYHVIQARVTITG
jgi:hypothetical protein